MDFENLIILGKLLMPISIPLELGAMIAGAYAWLRDYQIGRNPNILVLPAFAAIFLMPAMIAYLSLKRQRGWFDFSVPVKASRQYFTLGVSCFGPTLAFIYKLWTLDEHRGVHVSRTLPSSFILLLSIGLAVCVVGLIFTFFVTPRENRI
jgi:hypothetical protein